MNCMNPSAHEPWSKLPVRGVLQWLYGNVLQGLPGFLEGNVNHVSHSAPAEKKSLAPSLHVTACILVGGLFVQISGSFGT